MDKPTPPFRYSSTNYSSELAEAEGYIHLSINGKDITVQDVVDTMEAAANYCREKSINKLLVEDRTLHKWQFSQVEAITHQLGALGYTAFKMAVFMPDPKKLFTLHFGQSIANRIDIDLMTFIDVDAAKKWLLSSPGTETKKQ